jgi:hypothetical protein
MLWCQFVVAVLKGLVFVHVRAMVVDQPFIRFATGTCAVRCRPDERELTAAAYVGIFSID